MSHNLGYISAARKTFFVISQIKYTKLLKYLDIDWKNVYMYISSQKLEEIDMRKSFLRRRALIRAEI